MILQQRNSNSDLEFAENMAREVGVSLPVAKILCGRGMDIEDARKFLHMDLKDLCDPFLFRDMKNAVTLIRDAIRQKRKIVVYGDYDVDGITATSLLILKLKKYGADVSYYLPQRFSEGYGLNMEAVQSLRQQGFEMMITVDCGITAIEEIAFAKELGFTVVLTDHHQALETIPAADAVICPSCDGYPDKNICGAGVAAKLIQAVFGKEEVYDCLDLVALGTVADVVPLLGENRIFVAKGLEILNTNPREGIRRMMELAGLLGKKIGAGNIAFQIGPRLNAAGRMGQPQRAVELLTAQKDPPFLLEIEEDNTKRHSYEDKILQDAREMIRHLPFEKHKTIILRSSEWHMGVIGIAASKLSEQYMRPVLLMCDDGTYCTASARSISGVNIFEYLKQFSHYFLKFGGHAAAAGFKIKSQDFEQFAEEFNQYIISHTEPLLFMPQISYDLELRHKEVTMELVYDIAKMEPFGQGNPKPKFLFKGVTLENCKLVGKDQTHLKCEILADGKRIPGIGFQLGKRLQGDGNERVDLIAELQENRWMGNVSVQCMVKNFAVRDEYVLEKAEKVKFLNAFFEHIIYNYNIKQKLDTTQRWDEIEKALRENVEGTAILCYNRQCLEKASNWIHSKGLEPYIETAVGSPQQDIPAYNLLLAAPEPECKLDAYKKIFLLDFPFLSEEKRCVCMDCQETMERFLEDVFISRERLLQYYSALKEMTQGKTFLSFDGLYATLKAVWSNTDAYALKAALRVFEELDIIQISRTSGLRITFSGSGKKNLNDSATFALLQKCADMKSLF